MAVAADCGGFSIREYTASMRNRDLRKCWPFGSEVREGVLPPIDSPKHRWWLAELQTVRSAVDGEYQASPLSEPIICDRDTIRDGGAAEAIKENPRLVMVPKAKIPKRKSVADLITGKGKGDCEENNQETIAAVGPNPCAGQLETTDLEKSNKRRKERIRMSKRKKKDFEGMVKKDMLQPQIPQKQRKKRKRGSPVVDKGEEKRENWTALPANNLYQVPSVSKVTCTSEMIKDKDPTGKRKLKTGKKKKTRKRRNLKKISELQESVNSEQQNNINRHGEVIRTQYRDQEGKEGSKNKMIGDSSGDNHKLMARSPPLQGLCRVLSDVLAASRLSNSISENETNSAGEVALNNRYPTSMQFHRSESSEVGDFITASEGRDRSQSARRFDTMIDLNVPIEMSSGQDEEVNHNSSASGSEQRVKAVKETVTQAANPDNSINLSQPAVATVDSVHPTSVSPEPVRRGKFVNLNAVCYDGDSQESNLEAINKSWLTVMKEKMGKFVENYSRKGVLNGMPITLRGDLLHVGPNSLPCSQGPRTKNYQARSPASNPLPGVNSSEISSSNQTRWKSTEKCFLESRVVSAGKHGNCAGNLEPAANLCRSLASKSNAWDASSSSSYSQQALPTMRLMGTDVTICRNSRNDPCVDQGTSLLNRAGASKGFRGEAGSRLGPNFGGALPITRPVENYFHQNNSQTTGFSQGQFSRGERLTLQGWSNAWHGQGPQVRNGGLVFEERSTRNLVSGESSNSMNFLPKDITRWPTKEFEARPLEADILRQPATQETSSARFDSINEVSRMTSIFRSADPVKRAQIRRQLSAFQPFSSGEQAKSPSPSGPVKLSAGTRHVLKGGRKMME